MDSPSNDIPTLPENPTKAQLLKHATLLNTFLQCTYKANYRERPADIITFLKDPNYLGNSTNRGDSVYLVWQEELQHIFDNNRRFIAVLTGAIGTGKTFIANIGIAYVMHRILCLKDPWAHFRLAPSGRMNVTFFNLTKSLSASRGFQTLQSFLLKSPWFRQYGTEAGGEDKRLEIPTFSYSLCSPYAKGFGNIGEHVIAALMDKIDSPTESDKQKIRVLKAYEATMRRFESRFVIDGRTIARFFLVSSKQDEMSFLETFVEQMKGSDKVTIADIPLWKAKPQTYFSGATFPVKVGDKFSVSAIITNEDVPKAIGEGYKIIDVPVEYREYFERDIVGALRDIAGVSVMGLRKSKLFPSERFIRECYDLQKRDPIERVTIDIGLKDTEDLIQYMDLTKIRTPKGVPRCLHCDIAFTGDALGLAMSGIAGWATTHAERADGTIVEQPAPIVETDFVMRLTAKPGDRIPLHKVRKLVLDLKARGFNIKKYTSDLRLASEDTLQLLTRVGIDAGYLSVDKEIKHYMDFRNLVFEQRWRCHFHEYLNFELKNLEYDKDSQKINHPDKVKDVVLLNEGGIREYVVDGSKDLADAVCGSVVGCLIGVEAPMEGARLAEMVKKANETLEDKEKDPYWFMNAGRKKEEQVVASSSGQDPEELHKFIDIVKRANR